MGKYSREIIVVMNGLNAIPQTPWCSLLSRF